MVRFILYLVVLVSFSLNAQIDEKAQVKGAVDIFFEGFHKGDTTLMKSVMMDKIILQTAYRNERR